MRNKISKYRGLVQITNAKWQINKRLFHSHVNRPAHMQNGQMVVRLCVRRLTQLTTDHEHDFQHDHNDQSQIHIDFTP